MGNDHKQLVSDAVLASHVDADPVALFCRVTIHTVYPGICQAYYVGCIGIVFIPMGVFIGLFFDRYKRMTVDN
ncbi:hypothetical protein SK355_01050 [Candidatus Fukatsuia symbiotica]|uniref:hypothetical protein n=1 Tax=Candidatus Fukatsuia TaxID=1927833 RepID=UPI000E72D211|nr:hypothetical protein [Candidatus Fukatsuia symbiotica]MEA9443943.1 hypothetical protein [Candidatus Fukatsuia symbiotica]